MLYILLYIYIYTHFGFDTVSLGLMFSIQPTSITYQYLFWYVIGLSKLPLVVGLCPIWLLNILSTRNGLVFLYFLKKN